MTLSGLFLLGWLGLAQQPVADVPPPPDTPPAPATAAPAAEAPPAPPAPPTTEPAPAPPATAVPTPPADAAPAPKTPAPTTPAPAVPTFAPAQPVPAPDASAQTGPAPKFEFTLGGKNEAIAPYTHGEAKAADGKFEITPEDNTLKTVITGAAGANVFLGINSSAIESVQVTQEFDITCTDPSITHVVLTLESNLLGIIRSKHKASATLRVASATISPVGATTAPLYVSYPAYMVTGAQGYKYSEPQPPMTSNPLPLGRYVLQANFVIEATAGGILDGHSTAIFVPESEDLDGWEREHDPFAGDSHDDYGFTLTLKADSPPGSRPVAKKRRANRTLASVPAVNPTR